jgi:hypothetical protein
MAAISGVMAAISFYAGQISLYAGRISLYAGQISFNAGSHTHLCYLSSGKPALLLNERSFSMIGATVLKLFWSSCRKKEEAE